MPEDARLANKTVGLAPEEWQSVLAVLEMVEKYRDYDADAAHEIGTLRNKIQRQVASAN